MDSQRPSPVTGSAQVNEPAVMMMEEADPAVVIFESVSKWYGTVIGVNKLTVDIPPGVTGLLGPNGAGKSTFLQLATGQLQPDQGRVRVLGQEPWGNPAVGRLVGLCPEQDAFYEWMTGYEFVYTCARLNGMSKVQAKEAAERAMEQVQLTEHMNRAVRGYSKGMRQRTKIAQALVHNPHVLFLDEPLTGTDPVARRELMAIIMSLAEQGKSVIVSSHVLHEVEALTSYVILVNRGRLLAVGHVHQIRELMDKHPHQIVLVSDKIRELAARMVGWADVSGVKIDPANRCITVETSTPDAFYGRLPELSQADTLIDEIYSEDDSLEAVFKYLVKQ